MSLVDIEKINETYLKISTDESISYELRDKFSYRILNHQYNPKVKAGIWDGFIRLYNARNGLMKVGLLDNLIEYLKESNYDYNVDSNLLRKNTESHIRDFIENIKIPTKIEKRDYQIESIVECLVNKRRLLLSPTSSGKSFIIYTIIRYLNVKTLLIVPRIGLVDQMYSDFEDYSSLDDTWKVEDYCTKISSKTKNKEKENPKLISISTWQSMARLSHLYEDYEMVIVDEAHGANAKVMTDIIDSCVNAEYRFGFTGTINKELVSELMLNSLFGKTVRFIETREMIDRGFAAEIDINCIVLKYNKTMDLLKKENAKINKKLDKSVVGKEKFLNELEILAKHEKRNEFLCKLAMKLEGNTLLFFNRTDLHGKVLFDMLQNMVDDSYRIFYIDGSIKERNDIREAMESRETRNIGIFSKGTSSVGMSIKNIDNLILPYMTKDFINIVQTIGRGLRLSDTKKRLKYFDIADILSPKKNNFSYKHFIERLRIYEEEQHPYKIKEFIIE